MFLGFFFIPYDESRDFGEQPRPQSFSLYREQNTYHSLQMGIQFVGGGNLAIEEEPCEDSGDI